ncbi:MAG: cell division protein FtsZ, partial [Desulfobulbaceae bacterium]|nr:cell division protein FtsZ [Desulfobulbaceae bacterium]
MTAEKSDYLFSMVEEEARTRIVAMGIGGMGGNAMGNLAKTEIEGLEIYSVNTDMQSLDKCQGSQPVQIGAKRTAGKGAGGNSEVGRLSAEDDIEKLRMLVKGAELVFIAAGMGGGTGTGAAPVIAKLCREMEILTIGIVTTPMVCEGHRRMGKAQQGLAELRSHVDSLMVIENENLSLIMDCDDVSIIEVFGRADEVMVKGITAISGMINTFGYINLDLADIRNVLKRPSSEECADVLIGVGTASGKDRALKAAAIAMENPLLANDDIKGANNILINVSADENMGLNEAQSVMGVIADKAGDSDREIIMGIVTDNSLGEKISITLIATDMGLNKRNSSSVVNRVPIKQTSELSIGEIRPEIFAQVAPLKEDAVSSPLSEGICMKAHVGSEIVENFGSSPLIKNTQWQTP